MLPFCTNQQQSTLEYGFLLHRPGHSRFWKKPKRRTRSCKSSGGQKRYLHVAHCSVMTVANDSSMSAANDSGRITSNPSLIR
jgi:hypothetical protein